MTVESALRAVTLIMNDDLEGAEEGLKAGSSSFHKVRTSGKAARVLADWKGKGNLQLMARVVLAWQGHGGFHAGESGIRTGGDERR